jgi:hypothetical protein
MNREITLSTTFAASMNRFAVSCSDGVRPRPQSYRGGIGGRGNTLL